MKRLIHRPLIIAVVTAVLGFNANAAPPSGHVDFGKFTASGNGQFVEVQIRTNLISLAAKLIEKDQPEAAKLIRSVELVRVNVIGLSDANREEMTGRVKKIRAELESNGWDRNVTVREENGDDVGVYTKTRGGDALAGIAVTVIDKNDVVLVNIVGDVRPEQIVELGEKLHIKALKDLDGVINK